MADTKISELPVASSIASPDVAAIVQGGVTKQADVSLFGGSFTNVFTVDPNGNFQTVQAAINAIAVLAAGNDPPDAVVIDIGLNSFAEHLTIDNSDSNVTWPIVIFKGVTNSGNSDINATQSLAFTSLVITGDGNQLDIRVKDCACGSITTDSPLVVVYDNGNSNGNTIISTATNGGLTLGSMYGGGNGFPGAITANDTDILLFGITADAPGGSIVTCLNGGVIVANCGQPPEGTTNFGYTPSFFSINSGGTVYANDSLLGNVTCVTAHLVRSKIYGTLTTSDPTQPVTDDQGPYAYNYDFSRDGGASGTIALQPSSGSQGTNLPTNFVVTGAILEIITPPDSSAHLATIAMTSGESAADLKTAAVVSGAPWSTAGLKALTALLKTTGSRAPAIVVAVQDLTAGKFNLHIQGYLNP